MTPSPRLVQRKAIRAILAFHFQNPSGGVAEIDHFAVVEDVFFSLEPHHPPAARFGQAARRRELLKLDDFGPNEFFLEVAVDFPRSLVRGGARANRPGAALVISHGEERNQSEELIARADHPRDGRFLETVARQELPRLRVAKLGQFRLNFSADRRHRGLWPRLDAHPGRQLFRGVRPPSVFLSHVQDVKDRLRGKKRKPADGALLLLRERALPQGRLLFKRLLRSPQDLIFVLQRVSKRSEEHTSELQSLAYLVCRLLLEKKKKKYI